MGLIKSSAFVSTCNAFHSLSPSAATSNTSYRCLSNRDARCQARRTEGGKKQYATIAGDDRHDQGHHQEHRQSENDWPETPKGQSCPTPYQIFAISKNAPYSKARFYELVKIYHPDRNGHDMDRSVDGGSGASHATRLERYRLIVAAHTILSDPVKRNAYDRWGAGWAGKKDAVHVYQPQNHARGQPGPFTAWHDQTDSNIWSNATWEDWERWRDKQEGQSREPQSPLYVKNSTFVSAVLVLAAVGSSWNYNRAEAEGGRFLAARDAVHDQASKELRKVRQSTNSRAKDERIDWFLKNREAALLGTGAEELREEKARHVLPPQESCSSDPFDESRH